MRLIPDTGSALPAFAAAEGREDTELLIGRGDRNDVVIDDDRISSQHLRIFREERRWHVENISSVNRAFVADSVTEEELLVGFPRCLNHQETISLLVPRSRLLMNDVWFAYRVEFTESERNVSEEPLPEVFDNVSVSVAASERYDTKEWRSPFDTNPTFDSNDLAQIEKAIAAGEEDLFQAPQGKLNPVVELSGTHSNWPASPAKTRELARKARTAEILSSKWDDVDTMYAPADEVPPEDSVDAMNRLVDKWLGSGSSSDGGLPSPDKAKPVINEILSPASASGGYLGGASRSPPSARTSPVKEDDKSILWPPPDMM